MYYPHYKKNKRNVPILRKQEIDIIAERYVQDFMPQILEHPQPFDIEGFIERYLNLQLDYQYLSNDGRYLGMTVFNDTNKVVVYCPEQLKANYIHAEHGTVIIDNTLLDKKKEHRYRFTIGHESGHWVFHKEYFGYNSSQISLFETNLPYIKCREINANYTNSKVANWNEANWMEWQADKFSAGILMPATSVRQLYKSTSIYYINEYEMSLYVATTFNVSKQAAYLRLCDLGYIKSIPNDSIYEQLPFL